MKKANAVAGQSMLVDGISGTLGLGAALLGLAMGITRILGTGRNRALLERVEALAPDRIEVHTLGHGSTAAWAKSRTGGDGVDFMISALGPGSPASTMLDSLQAVRRGGRAVNVGAVAEPLPLDVHWLMDEQIQLIGSNWFTPRKARRWPSWRGRGCSISACSSIECFPLEEVNRAISGLQSRNGGFSNYVIVP